MRAARLIPIVASLCLLASLARSDGTIVKALPDHADGIYALGEQTTFTIQVLIDDTPVTTGKISYILSKDGVGDLGRGELDPAGQPLTVTGSLQEPGVLRCTVTYEAGDTRVHGFGGAAYAPGQIQPGATMPEDFDEYWEGEKAKLRAIPMDARLEEKEGVSNACRVWKISLANVDGRRVYGWIAVPGGDGPFPAVMTFTAAGVRGTGYGTAAGWASRGFLSMHIIHHNFDVETPREVTDALYAGELKGYYHQGREDRDTYYFHHVFLGCVRALDYLTSRPEWDGEHLTVTGSSQGGGLSLCLAGLHEKVTALAANVPALCDHTGFLRNQASGWPRLVPGDDDGTIAQVSRYYDAVNFARKFTGAAWVTLGLIDRTCPATSVYAAYNSLGGEKVLLVFPQMGHAVPPDYGAPRIEWIKQHSGME
ncbi:MAG: acetylxylan esterase [Armatimonadetes bacterium]|nr:acetylxylan esterase [Armatimonadota bacterium]